MYYYPPSTVAVYGVDPKADQGLLLQARFFPMKRSCFFLVPFFLFFSCTFFILCGRAAGAGGSGAAVRVR